jgi:glycosyltransferase involved in cell wall biosynthesis
MLNRTVSILGTRGLPARHGGFETFAQNLAPYLAQKGWRVTVYCQSEVHTADIKEDFWNGIELVHVAPFLGGTFFEGSLGTAIFDWRCLWHAKTRENGIWLTLGYNTGIFNLLPRIWGKKQIINMDGVEWRRGKWSLPFKAVFYICYWFAGLSGNRLIADHPEIEKMMSNHFYPSKMQMIAYGAPKIAQADAALLERYGLTPQQYMISIARIEPENSILEIVRAWSRRKRGLKLVVLGNFYKQNEYHQKIHEAASGEVVFPGAIFDAPVVAALRFHALAYVHGHTVGGTNPSLVEALGAGNAVIAHDNPYNRWVADGAGIYFADERELAAIFDNFLKDFEAIERQRQNARNRHAELFEWEFILGQYEKEMLSLLDKKPQEKPAAELETKYG